MYAKGNCLRRCSGIPLTFLLILFGIFVMAAEILLPEASGVQVFEKQGTVLDTSNADQGYVMIRHRGNTKRLKLRVTNGETQFDYDISPEDIFEVIPLQMGDGTYLFRLFEQSEGDKYSPIFSQEVQAELADENIVYLYPNQYVQYDADSSAVALSMELCADLTGDMDKVKAVAGYIKSNIIYDYMKALQVTGGSLRTYLPNVEETLSSGQGICFDFASLMACMLRVQGIPTKVVIGYADATYHAWNHVLIDGRWARFDPTFEVTGTKVETYTEERWY